MTISTQLYANNAKTTLSLGIALTDTSISVVDASKFPQITVQGQFYMLTLDTGTVIEIIKVTAAAGNTLTVVRGQEGTVPAAFPSGTVIENRITSGTLTSFATTDSVMTQLTSVDLLTAPINSDSGSYICYSLDDGSNPTVAIRSTNYTWRFTNYPKNVFSGTVQSSTALTNLTSTVAPATVNSVVSGKFLIQFTTGSNAGSVRVVGTQSNGAFTWTTPLAYAPVNGDQFEVYQSTPSIITDLEGQSSNSIIYAILLGD